MSSHTKLKVVSLLSIDYLVERRYPIQRLKSRLKYDLIDKLLHVLLTIFAQNERSMNLGPGWYASYYFEPVLQPAEFDPFIYHDLASSHIVRVLMATFWKRDHFALSTVLLHSTRLDGTSLQTCCSVSQECRAFWQPHLPFQMKILIVSSVLAFDSGSARWNRIQYHIEADA